MKDNEAVYYFMHRKKPNYNMKSIISFHGLAIILKKDDRIKKKPQHFH